MKFYLYLLCLCFAVSTKASDIYLVLASANQRNAASAMGHLFLADGSPIYSYYYWDAIDYAARVDSDLALLKGLAGYFTATYSLLSLEDKIEFYNKNEERDLLFFRIKFSGEERERYDDTLKAWLSKKEDYKFLTNNCSHGIYRLLQSAMDSIPEPYEVLLPQDVVNLLQRSGRIDSKPSFIISSKSSEDSSGNLTSRKNYVSPHPYIRADVGYAFPEGIVMLKFQPLLHDRYDRYGFYQADHELSFLSLYFGVKGDSIFIDKKKTSVIKTRSANPSNTFSWELESSLFYFELGGGKSFALLGGKLGMDYFFKIRKNRGDYFFVPELTLRSRLVGDLRYGIQGELLREIGDRGIKPIFNSWLALDIEENSALILKAGREKDNFMVEIAIRRYFVR